MSVWIRGVNCTCTVCGSYLCIHISGLRRTPFLERRQTTLACRQHRFCHRWVLSQPWFSSLHTSPLCRKKKLSLVTPLLFGLLLLTISVILSEIWSIHPLHTPFLLSHFPASSSHVPRSGQHDASGGPAGWEVKENFSFPDKMKHTHLDYSLVLYPFHPSRKMRCLEVHQLTCNHEDKSPRTKDGKAGRKKSLCPWRHFWYHQIHLWHKKT